MSSMLLAEESVGYAATVALMSRMLDADSHGHARERTGDLTFIFYHMSTAAAHALCGVV